jgi:hypothetical protein
MSSGVSIDEAEAAILAFAAPTLPPPPTPPETKSINGPVRRRQGGGDMTDVNSVRNPSLYHPYTLPVAGGGVAPQPVRPLLDSPAIREAELKAEAEAKRKEDMKEPPPSDADLNFQMFVHNLIGALEKDKKRHSKEKEIVALVWPQKGTPFLDNDGKTVLERRAPPHYPRVKDRDDFNKRYFQLFKPAGYFMFNSALVALGPSITELLTPYDHISIKQLMPVFTLLCVAVQRKSERAAQGINDTKYMMAEGDAIINSCRAAYAKYLRDNDRR